MEFNHNNNVGAGSQRLAMTQEYEQKLVRACLAALARRISVGLVVTFADIEAEYEKPSDLSIAVDGDAKCVRIAAAGVQA
jgi:hypothetical protein